MHCSYAMTALRVTPPADEEGADVEVAKEAEGVAVSVCGRIGRSWTSLRLTVAASMAHITENEETWDMRQKNGKEFA